MRVLLLNQTYYPDPVATSQQLRDFARYLKSEGCEVTVMTSRRAYDNPKKTHPAEEWVDGVRVVRVACTGFGKRSFFHRMVDGFTFECLLLWKLLFFRRQDLVIGFTSPPLVGFAALLFCALRGGKCVQWIMDLNPDIAFAVGYLNPRSLLGRFLTFVLRFTVRYSDYVIVLDRWMRSRLVAHGVRAENTVVVPPWPVSESPTLDSQLGKKFRARHGLGHKFVVLYSGNHSIAHSLDTVLETALRLRDDPNVLFLFIGGGLRENDVTSFRETHRLSNIRQLPYQPRELLSESLSAADLHLVLMGKDLSGLVHVSKIYGVLATGRPYAFIGPRSSHVADLLAECPYGFAVESEDVDGFVKTIAMARALTEAQKREIFQKNTAYARENCSTKQSLATFMSQVVEPLRSPQLSIGELSPHQLPSRA